MPDSLNTKDPVALRARIRLLTSRIAKLKRWRAIRMRQLQTLLGDIPANQGGWHAKATRVPYTSAGAFTAAGHKLVWHTTEGFGLPVYSGSAPHFTLDPKSGRLWQHIPITQAAKSLEHPAGTVETNRAHAIQVELIGFAKDTAAWPDAYYTRIGALARWIELYAKVPRAATVTFAVPAKRMGAAKWTAYAGHCGHQHVPNNSHWDPGAFQIDKVLR